MIAGLIFGAVVAATGGPLWVAVCVPLAFALFANTKSDDGDSYIEGCE